MYHGDTGRPALTSSRLVVRKRRFREVDVGGGFGGVPQEKGAGGAGRQVGRRSYC